MSELMLDVVVSDLFAENAYVLWRKGDTQAVVVDPGFSPDKMADMLAANQLTPVMVLLTHGHSDHIAGVGAIKEQWPDCPVVIGAGDAYKLTDPEGNLSAKYGFPIIMPEAERTVTAGEVIEVIGLQLEVRETPGHSAGHVVFVFEQAGQHRVLGGDVLFRGSIGRTDFADGSLPDLKKSIQEQLFTLPAETVVYPGHGPTTTVGEEQQTNPFVGRLAEDE